MKNRILSLLIASVMVFGLMTVPSYAATAESIDYSKDIEFINAIGITEFVPENPNEPITRRDAVVMAFGLTAKDYIEPGYNGEFADVPVGDVDGGKLLYAVENGLIAKTNNEKFIPDGKVKYIDALKLVFNAINYGHLVQGMGNGDSEYYKLASKYDVSVEAANTSELTAGEFAHLVALAAEAPLLRVDSVEEDGYINYRVDESVNVLSAYYDIYVINGTVEKNNFTSLYEADPLSDWGISIDGVTIYCDDTTDTQSLLGRKVYAYYQKKGMKLVYYTFENDNDIIRLECEDIDKFSNNAYYVEEGTKTKKYPCTRNAAIIYNGVAVTSSDYSLFMALSGFVPANGWVELIKNDSGSINCVKITNYKTYVVQGVDTYNKKIIDKYGEPVLSLDTVETLFVCDALGEAVKLDYIDGMNVLSVAAALSGLSAKVFVTAEAVEGAFTAYDGEKIWLEGEEFAMSASLKEKIAKGTVKLPDLNEETIIYFDARGLVAVCEASPNTGWSYGFLTQKALTSGLDAKFMIKLLTTDEGFKEFDVARIVRIDGKPFKKNHKDAHDAITDDKLNVPIKYRVTAFGEIKDIDTPVGSPETETSLKLVHENESTNWNPSNLNFTGGYFMKSASPCFTVPLTPSSDERDYAAGTAENMFKKDFKYSVAIYGEDPEELVNTVVVKRAAVSAEVAASDIIAVVNEVTRAFDSEGNAVWKIYAVKEGTSNTYTVDDSIYNHKTDADPLEKGDIIRMSYNDRLEVSALERTFDNDTREISDTIVVEKPSDPFSVHLYPADNMSRMFYLAYGKTLRFKNNILEIKVDDDKFIRYYLKGRVIVVDKEGVRVGSSSDFVLDASGAASSDILIEMRYSNVRTIVVYKDK